MSELYPRAVPFRGDDCGMCLHASDIGISAAGDPIAYSHPGCPYHGHCNEFAYAKTDNMDRRVCTCGAYEDEHYRDMP